MATSSEASSETGGSLTKKLRRYFAKHVKISEADMERTRRMVADYVDDKVMRYCKEKSTLPILRLEYTGSVYTRLKTEAADEVDIMVVLKTTKQEVTVQSTSVPGYAVLKASETSPLHKYADQQGYIDPERLRNGWFYSLVYQAVTDPKASSSPLQMQVRAHGPAVQLDINEKSGQKLLSADLVPCFHIADNYYVAKPYKGARNVGNSDLLWRLSSSMEEKKVLEYMDRDHGCRHELLRIMKTIVKREEATSLGKLTSYHLKTVFLQYMNKRSHEWTGPNSLGDNFLGFIRELKDCLERGTIEQYRQPRVNLLEDIDPVVIRKMADRLKRILNSEVERYKILDN